MRYLVIITMLMLICAPVIDADKPTDELCDLSGILLYDTNMEHQYLLELDGCTGQRIKLIGEILNKYPKDGRVWVRGHFVTQLVNPIKKERALDGDGPFKITSPYWYIYMDVHECRSIKYSFNISEE